MGGFKCCGYRSNANSVSSSRTSSQERTEKVVGRGHADCQDTVLKKANPCPSTGKTSGPAYYMITPMVARLVRDPSVRVYLSRLAERVERRSFGARVARQRCSYCGPRFQGPYLKNRAFHPCIKKVKLRRDHV